MAETSEKFDETDLADCIGLSIEQAEAVILRMQEDYNGDKAEMVDAINWCILEILRKEILDIKTIVNWYVKKTIEVKNAD
jgi:hypothetical protein